MTKVIAYLQFEPTYGYNDKIIGAKATRITQSKPADLRAGAVTVQLDIDFPLEMFNPARAVFSVPLPEIPEVQTNGAALQLVPSNQNNEE